MTSLNGRGPAHGLPLSARETVASSDVQPSQRPATSKRPADDSWVDQVADRLTEILAEEGLQLELVVFYDPIAETLHAIGFDGAPTRYFSSLESATPVIRALPGKSVASTHAATSPP